MGLQLFLSSALLLVIYGQRGQQVLATFFIPIEQVPVPILVDQVGYFGQSQKVILWEFHCLSLSLLPGMISMMLSLYPPIHTCLQGILFQNLRGFSLFPLLLTVTYFKIIKGKPWTNSKYSITKCYTYVQSHLCQRISLDK